MSLENKVVLVTGASSGIGAAIALEALRVGAKVSAVGRNREKLDQVVAECESATGKKPFVIIADVTNEDEAKEIINATVKEFGKLDVLVNNAGFGRLVNIEDADALTTYDAILRTNLRAVIHLTQLSIPHLAKTKGNIVNVSSVASTKTHPNFWPYSASKAALDNFSKNMAVDLAVKGIRVNIVNPGPVSTDFHENMGLASSDIEARRARMSNMTLLGRYSQSKEVADLIVFLASDKAVGVTGAGFVIDNGLVLK